MFDFFKVQKVSEVEKAPIDFEEFEDIDFIAEYFKCETGIDFENQKFILKSKVKSFCRINEISSFKNCLDEIHNDLKFRQKIIDYLTTNESFFYRELNQIKSFVEKIQNTKNNIKILCAPSATGEEPYSIVIALLEAGVCEDRFSITGIDISSNAIEKSKEAIYNEKSVRNLSDSIRSNYFTIEKDLYHLNEDIRKKVSFKCINIFDDSFTSLEKFDYIFSRNMLIYFDSKTRLKAKSILIKQLVDETQEIYFGHADLF